jgi:hypothetical protein
MEWRRTLTKEEEDARDEQRKSMLRMTQAIERYKADPLADVNTPPHMVGKR